MSIMTRSRAPEPHLTGAPGPDAHRPGGHGAGGHGGDRTKIVNRLKRIEGQVAGLARMVEADRYCIDILTQLQAVKAALSKVEDPVLSGQAAQ